MDIRICIDVDDIERGIAFYTQGLGLRVGRRLKSDWVELLGAGCPIDLLCEAAGSAPLGEDKPARRDFARHWTPVHLDFVVDDVDAAAATLVALGAKLERPVVQRRWGRMANLADPFGHGIDLLQFQGKGYDEMLQGN
jgi:catechol 2,3-dioxygenase-like lactoylglutathione lyase family enzyme